MKVCVFGSASNKVPYLDLAFETGQLLAKAGHRIVYGGSCYGIMGKLAEGAILYDGIVFGVIPQILVQSKIQNATRLYVTKDMHIRKIIMNSLADCFLVLPGGIGTLEEALEVLNYMKLNIYKTRPFVFLNPDGLFDDLIKLFNNLIEKKFAAEEYRKKYEIKSTPAEAVNLLEAESGQTKPKWDLYISYSHNHDSKANDIVSRLREKGFSVWFDQDIVPPGANFIDCIAEGLNSSRLIVFLVDVEFFSRSWTGNEMNSVQNGNKPFCCFLPDERLLDELYNRYPWMKSNYHIVTSDIEDIVDKIYLSFKGHFPTHMPAHHTQLALIAGGGQAGCHIMEQLLQWRSVPIRGIYDKSPARCVKEIVEREKEKGNEIKVYKDYSSQLDEMLSSCSRGSNYHVFAATRDPDFEIRIHQAEQRARINGVENFKIHWLDWDIEDTHSAESIHKLMRQ